MNSVAIFITALLIFSSVLYYSKPSWVVVEKDDKKVIKPLSFLGLSIGLSLLLTSIVEQIKENGLRHGLKFAMSAGKPSLSFFGIDLNLF